MTTKVKRKKSDESMKETSSTRSSSVRSLPSFSDARSGREKLGRSKQETTLARNMCLGKIFFILLLAVVSIAIGILINLILINVEKKLAKNKFFPLAEKAVDNISRIFDQRRHGSITLATTISNIFHNVEDWPNVALPGYEEIASDLIETSAGRSMGFFPIVLPEQLPAFEEYAKEFLGSDSFGKGVWGKNTSTGEDYRVTDGSTTYGSPYDVIVPMIQHSEGKLSMLSLRYEEMRGRAFDSVKKCAEDRQNDTNIECGVITNFIKLTRQGDTPGALMFEPIFPAKNKRKLVGVISSSILWRELLKNVFDSNVTGIDCVFHSVDQSHTFTINGGNVLYLGKGDRHNSMYDDHTVKISLTRPGDKYNTESSTYDLRLYAKKEFYDTFSSDQVHIVLGFVLPTMMFLVTAGLFLLYDRFVNLHINYKGQLLEEKRAFVRFVSHEVRTPINSVIMGLTLLKQEIATTLGFHTVEALSEETKNVSGKANGGDKFNTYRLTQDIYDNALRSVEVLNDLLNYDKIEMGTLKLELVIVPIRSLVEASTNEFKGPLEQKKIEFSLDFTDVEKHIKTLMTQDSTNNGDASDYLKTSHDLRCIGDDVRLAQVIRNLLSNAIKFTPDEKSIRVHAHLQHNTSKQGNRNFTLKRGEKISVLCLGKLRISVSDTGAGMTQEQVSKAFEEGVQFNANTLQKGNGTGLGLHIANRLMKLHDGKLEAFSDGLHSGCTFTITIPLYDVKENIGIEEEHEVEAISKPVNFERPNFRILVVDDSKMNRKLLCRLLKNEGHDCDEAEDGDIALKMVKKSMKEDVLYHTVLLDFEMPRLSGPPTAKAMRNLGSDVFIVGVTGNLLPDDVKVFLANGANAVLPKPFNMASLEDLWVEFGLS